MCIYPKKVYCVIPAAGVGSRMNINTPKQYLSINNKTIIEFSIEKILTAINVEQVVVALHPQDNYFAKLPIAKHPKVRTVQGGKMRRDSVLNAIQTINAAAALVLIHDAVRPCVSIADIRFLYDNAVKHNISAILSNPVSNTIKLIAANSKIIKTLDRDQLRQAVTPQIFDKDLLLQILLAVTDNTVFTDEASAVESAGYPVLSIDSNVDNIKLTTKKDFYVIEQILKSQEYEIV